MREEAKDRAAVQQPGNGLRKTSRAGGRGGGSCRTNQEGGG